MRLEAPLQNELWSWIAVGRFNVDLTFGFDNLTAALLLVVTGVGFLIHVYSVGYMSHDPGYARYFAFLNFFIFAMSVLALGRSLPVMFIGWEGVGLASYLLIGFWYSDQEKAKAGKKAFITNRIGDFGFLIGIFTLFGLFGTGDFLELQTQAGLIKAVDAPITQGIFQGFTPTAVITFACISLFVGAMGKSAQIPLYVWLPDAMAGPTPVSALIHAATMVTAGVYMVVRCFFLYDMAPIALEIVAWVGGATALFSATIGLAQNDIKKVLAYSTVSQLGYMFLAAGLGAYSFAIFHLVTHAFFKACLFLGSGAVIHACHDEQDMRRMGGLKKKLPWVYWTFLASTLALTGVAPFAGFFSKDAILGAAFQENKALWIMGFLGAGLTALYMMRLLCLTFYGELRLKGSDGKPARIHAPGFAMTMPLVILAVLATVAGLYNMPHVFHGLGIHATNLFDNFLATNVTSTGFKLHMTASTEWILIGASVGWAVLWLFVGYVIYKNGPSKTMDRLTQAGIGRFAHWLLYGKWFVDEIYQAVVIKPLHLLASVFAVLIDPWIIDGLGVKGASYTIQGAGKALSKFQTGNVQNYAAVMVFAVAAIILWVVQ